MNNNSYTIKLICSFAFAVILCSSCNPNSESKTKSHLTSNFSTVKEYDHLSIAVSNNQIIVNGSPNKSHIANVKVDNIYDNQILIHVGDKLDIVHILKNNSKSYVDLAYTLAKNNGDIAISLNVPGVIDTTIHSHINISNAPACKAEIINGIGARLSKNAHTSNIDSDIRKWLYQQGIKQFDELTIGKMKSYLKELHKTNKHEYTTYTTNEDISLISSFRGIHYKIKSTMKADNYYLFACNTEMEVEEFIEEMIAINFESSTKSLTQSMPCFRSPNASSLNCILLVGINNDGCHQIEPVGLVCIDNNAPIHTQYASFTSNNDFKQITFNKYLFSINHNSIIPNTKGVWRITYGKFQGHTIPYTITWSGDVTKIVIHTGKHKSRTISLSDKTSPYHVSIYTDLIIGDNYIQVDAYDKVGNKNKYDLHIETVGVKNNSPDINIYNDISINNEIWN